MKIHLLTGFLGSGKTTAIQHAARILLQKGIRVGVITNDQGMKLVDGDYFKALNIPGRQVVNGCFCCNYDDLDAGIQSLIDAHDPDLIYAESVGSCTDIVATVLKPLLQFRPDAQTTVSTFADIRLLRMMLDGKTNSFDETVNYIYRKQLEEAGVIVINKIDMVNEDELKKVERLMQEKYGSKLLLYQNSLDRDSIRKWLVTLDEYQAPEKLPSLTIDYDIYAAGEAQLAWFDQELEIYSSSGSAMADTELLINRFYQKVTTRQYPIGHLKFLVNDTIKISITPGMELLRPLPGFSKNAPEGQRADAVRMLVNIRVQTSPDRISQLVGDAISEVERERGCKIIVNSLNSFQPVYPTPVHRL